MQVCQKPLKGTLLKDHFKFHQRMRLMMLSGLLAFSLVVSGCTRTPKPVPSQVMPTITKEADDPSPQVVAVDPGVSGTITISSIQGAGHVSPFENQQVEGIHGIVTAIRADGFYMQSLVPDNDPATSEGIYVLQGLIPSVRSGDEVLVNGLVKEGVLNGDPVNDLMITHIRHPSIEILSRGNPLPPPIIIGQDGRIPPTEVIDGQTQGRVIAGGDFNPHSDGLDFFESLEGMLVQINNAVVVGPTNQYKEIVVLPDNGAWASTRTPRGGIIVQQGDFNPERVILDDALREMPFVQVGDYSQQPIVGVMDYAYGNYKVQPIADVNFLAGNLQPSVPLTPALPGQIRVVTYNVEVLSALDSDRIKTLADHIVNGFAAPDIIGFQEIADNDGVTGKQAASAELTYQGIISAIAALGGPPYGFVDIEPLPDKDGGVPGANIRVGFLYRLDRDLSLVDAPRGDAQTPIDVDTLNGRVALSLNPGRIDPTNSAFTNSRKPLVVSFLIEDQPLFVINNHFISKGGDHALFGAVQPPILNSEVRRDAQAQVVYDFVETLLKIDPNSRIIVLGDLNDFHFSSPLETLKGDLLYNLIETLPVEERYTYIYEGNSQVLDHILVSEALYTQLLSVDILHLNSEFDYWHRFSDHDPIVATFKWESATP